MRKKNIFFIIVMLLLITGCKKIDNTTTNYKNLILEITSKNSISNKVSNGYKYYLPRNTLLKEDTDFNQIFKIYNTNMYLYVDIVSYYYKNKLNLSDNEQYDYYYESFDIANNKGYIGISKKNDKYFLKIVYNYAKIEVYTTEEYLSSVVTYSIIILNSVDYNDNLIKKIIEEDSIYSNEITYELDKPNDNKSNFSQYLKEYVQIDEATEKLPDE